MSVLAVIAAFGSAKLTVIPTIEEDLVSTDTQQSELIRTAVAHLGGMGNPDDVMVNRVLEIDEQGQIVIYDLPKI